MRNKIEIQECLESLVTPFGISPIWEDAKGIKDEETYYDFLMNAWFYYLSHKPSWEVLRSISLLGEDPDNLLEEYVQGGGINLSEDNWGIAYMKLCKHTGFDILSYWVRWPTPSNELGFMYPVGSQGTEVCSLLLDYLVGKLEVKSNEVGSINAIKFIVLEESLPGVIGKSDKPWLK